MRRNGHAGLGRLTSVRTRREAPVHIIEALRAIDPTAELVELKPGVWILGVVSPNSERTKMGERMLARALRRPMGHPDYITRIRFARLVIEGFRQIQMYRMADADWRIVEDFRERDFNYRAHLEEKLREAEREMSGEAAEERSKAIVLERARALATDLGSIVFRKRKSVRMDGLKGRES